MGVAQRSPCIKDSLNRSTHQKSLFINYISIFYFSGYGGNVRRDPNHVFIPDALNAKNKIILPDVEKSNRDFNSQSTPKIMDQILGPKAAPPLMANGTGHGKGKVKVLELLGILS